MSPSDANGSGGGGQRPLHRRSVALLAATAAAAGLAAVVFLVTGGPAERNSVLSDTASISRGEALYAEHCAACHGVNLEGQADWQTRRDDGRLPAPPHDESGHTWHHADSILFEITRNGIAAFAPLGYESDMPAYAGILGDAEIRAVLAFIKSRWPEPIQARQAEIDRNAGG